MTDIALEEIGTATGQFGLTVFVNNWQLYSRVGVDDFGSSSVGPWQSYASGASNSMWRRAIHSRSICRRIPTDPRSLLSADYLMKRPSAAIVSGSRVLALFSDVRRRRPRKL